VHWTSRREGCRARGCRRGLLGCGRLTGCWRAGGTRSGGLLSRLVRTGDGPEGGALGHGAAWRQHARATNWLLARSGRSRGLATLIRVAVIRVHAISFWPYGRTSDQD